MRRYGFVATLLIGTLLCAVVLAGCDSFYGATTTVHGTVVDKESGAPLADISVALTTFGSFGPPVAEASTVTDARGRFVVSTDFDKQWSVQFSAGLARKRHRP